MSNIINVARGFEKADLVIKNANIVNVLSEEIHKADIAIKDGIIAGIGENYSGEKEIDIQGAYVTPSFIDGHVHLESTMMLPSEFAKVALPAGTTTVIIDPHEISNVLGLHGISFMHEAVKNLPLDVYTMLPSCVPATPFETSGFDLNSYDLSLLIDKPWVLGLAEMMNFPGVLNQDNNVMAKLELAKSRGKCIDGHAPYLHGKDLCAYIASGVKSDHECTTPDEAVEKLRLGMYVMVREGTAAKDLDALMPVLKTCNTRKCIFVTDDRHPADLKEHINGMVRRAVEAGVDPVKAIQIASLNTAEYFGLKNLGAIAPGYKADLLILPDLKTFKPDLVIKNGVVAAENGKLIAELPENEALAVRNSVNVRWITPEDFRIEANGSKVTALEVIPHQLITKSVVSEVKIEDGNAVSNIDNDTLKICVIERHRATGNIGKGFVKGFNLKCGAIASTVAHDSHNMIVIGTNDADMYAAAVALIKCKGGKVVVKDGEVISELPLPIAGLMSDRNFDYVVNKCEELNKTAHSIGCRIEDPFMTMGFLSLPVIPELKVTDKGVFDTNKFDFIDIFEKALVMK
ncbi:TPA: adenine deaminase [Candidatus Gastranaerophilales bacterium HUM_13]|mgnify:FL=1|jgi:adenine deaminase|nr:MAG TPA: adenine deaminase [Candidatus Gastranaerophilales bacterium HUM_8]DAB05935.1 MAG TPA: adenine deaminase [Candidatus Gastranaerophilales bacterium HUM_13]DAB11825.1 MAG TPA: adenine deaminase [Candidatus Gastranaerophilales bacterium HUM_16]